MVSRQHVAAELEEDVRASGVSPLIWVDAQDPEDRGRQRRHADLAEAARAAALVRVTKGSTAFRLAAFALAGTSVLLAGCGEEDDVGQGGGAQLDSRTFLSGSVDGWELVPGTDLRLSFDHGQLSAQAGCNSLSATYEVVDDRLEVAGDGMTTTDMGCDPQRHAQDEWLADLLQARPSITLSGSSLTLTTADAALHLVDRVVADPDRPLIGTRWRVDTVVEGDVASSVPTDQPVTLELSADRTITAVSEGCTSVVVDIDIDFDQGVLDLGEVLVDAIGCPVPWDATIELLRQGRIDFEIEATRLTLAAGDAGISAVAE